MTLFASFIQLGAGLAVGLSGLAAGFAVGIVGDAGVRGTGQQPRLYVGECDDRCHSGCNTLDTHRVRLDVGMILILIFAEVLGLYGLIGMRAQMGELRPQTGFNTRPP